MSSVLGAPRAAVAAADNVIVVGTAQLDKANMSAEKERANAAEYQKALAELERTNAVLTTKRGSLEKESARARESAAKEVAQVKREAEDARAAVDEARAKAHAAELQLVEQGQLVGSLQKQLDECMQRVMDMERHHAEEAQACALGDAARQRVVELERQANKQRVSHKQRLEELQVGKRGGGKGKIR